MKLCLVAQGILILCILLAAPSRADDPTPSTCRVSPIVACPGGDLRINVLVRKGRTPLGHALVTLDLGPCSELKMAAPLTIDPNVTLDGVRLTRKSAEDGHALFAVRAGGVSACSRILVLAAGVLIAERTAIVSPDQNGDMRVDQADLDILRAKLGTKDPTGDLDGDGRVTPSDVLAARLHLGHHADLATPTKTTTWGEIKAGYR